MKHAVLGTAVLLGLVTSLCGWRWAYSSLRATRNSKNNTDISNSDANITGADRVTKNITRIPTNFTNSFTNTSTNISNTVVNHQNSTPVAEMLIDAHPASSTNKSSDEVVISNVTQRTSREQGNLASSRSIDFGVIEATTSVISSTRSIPGLENVTGNSSQALNSTEEDIDYVNMGQELLVEASSILDTGIWDFERRTEDGDAIFSRQLNNGNMVYRLTGIVDMPAQDLLVIIYDGLADYPKWNPSLIECRVLEKINDQTDISYTVSAPGARGYVASRDFVSLRHWDMKHNTFVAASKSIDFPGAPSNPDYIRGRNGPGCMELRPLSSDSSKTEFRWLLNTRLNGWIPSYIADKAYKKFMTKYMVFLRDYCKKIKQRASDFTLSSTTPENITK